MSCTYTFSLESGKKIHPTRGVPVRSSTSSRARQNTVVKLGYSLKGGQIMKRADGKVVGGSWEMFCWLC